MQPLFGNPLEKKWKIARPTFEFLGLARPLQDRAGRRVGSREAAFANRSDLCIRVSAG